MHRVNDTRLNSFRGRHVHRHTVRSDCSKPASLSLGTTVYYEGQESGGGRPGDVAGWCGIISAADRNKLGKVIRRAPSRDVPCLTS